MLVKDTIVLSPCVVHVTTELDPHFFSVGLVEVKHHEEISPTTIKSC